jgi:hypothetical protein
MDRGRVGEDRGSKETDGCPLTSIGCALDALGQIHVRVWHPLPSHGYLFMRGLVLGGLVL